MVKPGRQTDSLVWTCFCAISEHLLDVCLTLGAEKMLSVNENVAMG